jgi:hypothetical protein
MGESRRSTGELRKKYQKRDETLAGTTALVMNKHWISRLEEKNGKCKMQSARVRLLLEPQKMRFWR